MNSLSNPRVFMRSLATRGSASEVSSSTGEALDVLKLSGFDLILLETAGIGQGDSDVVDLSDLCTYVMTPEYGAPSQLEKIDMIDFADFIVLNKFETKGAKDAVRDVRKQYRRSREIFDLQVPDEGLPVYGTIASRFNDPGVTALYCGIMAKLNEGFGGRWATNIEDPGLRVSYCLHEFRIACIHFVFRAFISYVRSHYGDMCIYFRFPDCIHFAFVV